MIAGYTYAELAQAFGGLCILLMPLVLLWMAAEAEPPGQNSVAAPGVSPSVSHRVVGSSHAVGAAPSICRCRCPFCGLPCSDPDAVPSPADYCADHSRQTADQCATCGLSAGDPSGPQAANAAQTP